MDSQTRISQLFGFYERMELHLEQARDQLTPLEILCVESIIDYRREQLVLLAEVERLGDSPISRLKKRMASGLGAAAVWYEQQLIKRIDDNAIR